MIVPSPETYPSISASKDLYVRGHTQADTSPNLERSWFLRSMLQQTLAAVAPVMWGGDKELILQG